MISSVLLAFFSLIALASISYLRFGSIRAAADFISGERILVDSTAKNFGSLPSGEGRVVSFLVTNMSGRPLGLVGSSTSCPCAVPTELPATIPNLGQKKIDVRVTRFAKDGPFDQKILLFLDDPAIRVLKLGVTGYVAPSSKIDGSKVVRP